MKLRYSIVLSLPLASATAMGAELALKLEVPDKRKMPKGVPTACKALAVALR